MMLFLTLAAAVLVAGCATGPTFIPLNQRKIIDREIVAYPGGMRLTEVVKDLTGPVDIDFNDHGDMIIAESGLGSHEPRIFGYHQDGTYFTIYPSPRTLRTPDVAPFNLVSRYFHIYGPIGGICASGKYIYVTHRDAHGFGVVTAFGYDGTYTTITASLPAQGDNGMGDVVVGPVDGRLYFGVGSATNSGVVGLDNWNWVKRYPDFCDLSYLDLKLNGFHFKSKNPDAGLFGAPDVAVTAPFQPFNVSSANRIRASKFPTAAIYSADPLGGGTRVEASGIRCPRGLAFNSFTQLYMTNDGMELRGTRPIADDPDALLKVTPHTWYGFPDYSTDLEPITDARFQPKGDMLKLLVKSGYPEISFLIDHNASNFGVGIAPLRNTLLQASFPSLSGAGLFDFVPDNSPFTDIIGSAIIPLSGDRAPFATSGEKLIAPVGFKVVRFDPVTRDVVDFITNAKGKPASMLPSGRGLLERPVAAKFAPDGSLYIVDFGRVEWKSGRPRVFAHTGRILKLSPIKSAARAATTRTSDHGL